MDRASTIEGKSAAILFIRQPLVRSLCSCGQCLAFFLKHNTRANIMPFDMVSEWMQQKIAILFLEVTD
jgi:hypothetical protein